MCDELDYYDADEEYDTLAYAYHVYPLDDYREHVLVKEASHMSKSFEEIDEYVSGLCWCKPRYVDGIILHNSMDKREFFEDGRLIKH